MAQPAHVPKFGNWDDDNISYTSFFENARKDKTPGTKKFNPNDPEDNPDAFVSGIFPSKNELQNNDSDLYGVVTRQQNKYGSRQDDELHQEYRDVQVDNRPYQGGSMELPARSKNRKNANSGSGSDKSSSDYSVQHPPHRRPSRRSDEESVRTPPSQQSGLRPDRSPQRAAMRVMPSSVPKFGVWDERDPTSGDGFTVIFNKVKQEKQIAATMLPNVPTEPTIYPSKPKNQAKSCSISKIICCFKPAVNE